MGWFYFAAVRCPHEHVSRYLSNKWAGQTFVYSVLGEDDGKRLISCHADVCRFCTSATVDAGEHWVSVMPTGVTDHALQNVREATRADEFCNVFYGLLRNESFFDYATTGVECGEFNTMAELEENLRTGHVHDGLVVPREIAARCNITLAEFSPSHVWVPKKPERWMR